VGVGVLVAPPGEAVGEGVAVVAGDGVAVSVGEGDGVALVGVL